MKFRLLNLANGKADIHIDGIIGSPEYFGRESVALPRFRQSVEMLGELTHLTVGINSAGGDVFEGLGIADYLHQHPAKVTIRVMGQAASIASVILMAGDKRVMARGATVFIHDPSAVLGGTAEDLRRVAGDLDKIRDSIINYYAMRTSLTRNDLREMMRRETRLTAEEALEHGFATSIDNSVTATNQAAVSLNKIPLTPQLAASIHSNVAAFGSGSQRGLRPVPTATRNRVSGDQMMGHVTGGAVPPGQLPRTVARTAGPGREPGRTVQVGGGNAPTPPKDPFQADLDRLESELRAAEEKTKELRQKFENPFTDQERQIEKSQWARMGKASIAEEMIEDQANRRRKAIVPILCAAMENENEVMRRIESISSAQADFCRRKRIEAEAKLKISQEMAASERRFQLNQTIARRRAEARVVLDREDGKPSGPPEYILAIRQARKNDAIANDPSKTEAEITAARDAAERAEQQATVIITAEIFEQIHFKDNASKNLSVEQMEAEAARNKMKISELELVAAKESLEELRSWRKEDRA